ncbi:MAG: DUF3798 domain-containing protein [Clostridia bacterium]|nr:DUF3798 domain-containing protein [Clostridia bacterium]
MKKLLCALLIAVLAVSMIAVAFAESGEKLPFHVGIITGTVSQSEDDRRGAEAFQAQYGEDVVKLATYPDNFPDEKETVVQTIVNMADDPDMKVIVVNQGVPGTAEAFRKIKEMRDDIICICGESQEDLPVIADAADLVVVNDFVSRGYLIIKTAADLGCKTFVHISFPRHLGIESLSRRLAVMEEAGKELGVEIVMETAPDPTSDVGVSGAQQYILEKTPEWVDKYGKDSAYFCTNDAHTEPLLKQLLAYGGYFIEADLPSPLMGYPGALGVDLTEANGDFEKILSTVEAAVVEKGGEGRFGTWAFSYGYASSYALAQHGVDVVLGKCELTEMDDISDAFASVSNVNWNGANYTDATTGVKTENLFRVYQDTYIMGNPGHFMGTPDVEIPEKYYTVH